MYRPKDRRTENPGFTLLELMLVVAIISLLAAIVIPKFSNLIEKAREAAHKGKLGSLRSALSIYYAENEGIYPHYNPLGMIPYTLNGKYIDLDRMVFRLPKYTGAESGSWGPSTTGRELYLPRYWGGSMWWTAHNNYSWGIDPIDQPRPWADPYFSYWVYSRGGASRGPGSNAHIGTLSCFGRS